jgi:hypothetical protein
MVATQASKVVHCVRALALRQHDGASGNVVGAGTAVAVDG